MALSLCVKILKFLLKPEDLHHAGITKKMKSLTTMKKESRLGLNSENNIVPNIVRQGSRLDQQKDRTHMKDKGENNPKNIENPGSIFLILLCITPKPKEKLARACTACLDPGPDPGWQVRVSKR